MSIMIDLIISKIIRPDLYPKFLNASINRTDIASYYGVSLSAFMSIINKKNPEHNRRMYNKFIIWQYLNQGEELKNIEPHMIKAISQEFDRFGLDSHEARQLPKKIHSIWLDQFKFYA